MKKPIARILPLAALSMIAFSVTACGTKTETEKTTVIEKPAPVEKKPNVSITVEGDGKNTAYEVHGEK
jgi:hypothetical protein